MYQCIVHIGVNTMNTNRRRCFILMLSLCLCSLRIRYRFSLLCLLLFVVLFHRFVSFSWVIELCRSFVLLGRSIDVLLMVNDFILANVCGYRFETFANVCVCRSTGHSCIEAFANVCACRFEKHCDSC